MAIIEQQMSADKDRPHEPPLKTTGARRPFRGPRHAAVVGTAIVLALSAVVLVSRNGPTKVATSGGDGRLGAQSDDPPAPTSTTAPAANMPSASPAPRPSAPAAPSPASTAPCTVPSGGGAFPEGRFGAVVVPSASGFILHGGRGADFTDRTDTWTVGCAGWQRRQPGATPPASDPLGTASAYDAARDEAVVLTSSGETWAWKGADWTRKGAGGPRLVSPRMAYDAARSHLVLVGGSGSSHATETWTWNGTAWAKTAAGTTPPPRDGASLVFDSLRGKTYFFGGAHEGGQNEPSDTWAWDGVRWSKLAPAHLFPPGPTVAAFDAGSGKVVTLAFGADGRTSETWLWDGSDWAKAATNNPPPRALASMAYVPAHQSVVLFGGKVQHRDPGELSPVREEVANDVWAWTGSDWTRVR